MTTLKEARHSGKLDQFIREHEKDARLASLHLVPVNAKRIHHMLWVSALTG